MLKKAITYTDYDGVERTENFYFNFTKAECTQLQFSVPGGMDKMLERLATSLNGPEMVDIYTMIIKKAYGEKSPDGRRFVKSKELSDEFEQTPAFSELFMELVSDDKAMEEFIANVFPKA